MPKSSSTRENLTSRVDKINKSEEIANLRAKTKAVENVWLYHLYYFLP